MIRISHLDKFSLPCICSPAFRIQYALRTRVRTHAADGLPCRPEPVDSSTPPLVFLLFDLPRAFRAERIASHKCNFSREMCNVEKIKCKELTAVGVNAIKWVAQLDECIRGKFFRVKLLCLITVIESTVANYFMTHNGDAFD